MSFDEKYSRVPTTEEYREYDGAHCHEKWAELDDDWQCPGCFRTKFQILRWTLRWPNDPEKSFMGWVAGIHGCFGSGGSGWDLQCDHCTYAETEARRLVGAPKGFKFPQGVLHRFISSAPHRPHRVYQKRAVSVYRELTSRVQGVRNDNQ